MASRSYTIPNKSGKASSSEPPKSMVDTGPSPAFMASKLKINRVKPTNPSPSGCTATTKRQSVKMSQDIEEVENGDEWAAAAKQVALAGVEMNPKRAKKDKGAKQREKRLRKFRAKAPVSYTERLQRVLTQRMFLIDRERRKSEDGTYEEESFDIAGSTGNIYHVTIMKEPSCTCPDAAKGNQCKHIIYVLVNVLKARSDLAYQLAFLTTELGEIFANAPSTPQSASDAPASTDTGGFRKPIEGDCPICVMEFDITDKSESIVWCKGACGNNIHKHCFEQWVRSKPGEVKCVYCRTSWKAEEPGDEIIKNIDKTGEKNAEGYVNVGSVLGLSGERDMSTYHSYWTMQEQRKRW